MIERLSSACGRDVSRGTFAQLEAFAELLTEEATKQNLIASSTIGQLWERHLIDSAQLVRFSSRPGWIDIGSGAGLPGVVIALLTTDPVTLVEPRRLRSQFLQSVKECLGATNLTIVHGKAIAAHGKFNNITARAVGPAAEILAMTRHLSHDRTTWVLPKGRSAQKELDDVRGAWHGEFRLEPSLTDPQASILLASRVKPRGKR